MEKYIIDNAVAEDEVVAALSSLNIGNTNNVVQCLSAINKWQGDVYCPKTAAKEISLCIQYKKNIFIMQEAIEVESIRSTATK
jgi:hypothetical protein